MNTTKSVQLKMYHHRRPLRTLGMHKALTLQSKHSYTLKKERNKKHIERGREKERKG